MSAVETRRMASPETGQMSAVETGRTSFLEKSQPSAIETGQMSTLLLRQDRCLLLGQDRCVLLSACPVQTVSAQTLRNWFPSLDLPRTCHLPRFCFCCNFSVIQCRMRKTSQIRASRNFGQEGCTHLLNICRLSYIAVIGSRCPAPGTDSMCAFSSSLFLPVPLKR